MRGHTYFLTKGGISFRYILNGGLGKQGRLPSNMMHVIPVIRKASLQYVGCAFSCTSSINLEQQLLCSIGYSVTVENFLNWVLIMCQNVELNTVFCGHITPDIHKCNIQYLRYYLLKSSGNGSRVAWELFSAKRNISVPDSLLCRWNVVGQNLNTT